MSVRIYKTDGSYSTVNDAGIMGNGGWHLTGGTWEYRKSIVIAHTDDGAQTDYQMKLLVGESSGATGEQVDCGGLVASDFDDLRFTTSDGETLCDYWIESLSGTTPNQLATVWIEVPSIAAHPDDTTIYMYYGGTTTAVSSITNTFIFGDDFSTAWNNPVKWTGDTSDASVSSGIMTLTAGHSLQSNVIASGDLRCRARINLNNSDYSAVRWQDADGSDGLTIAHLGTQTNHSLWQTGKESNYTTMSNTACGFGSYHIYEGRRIMNSGTDTTSFFLDGASVVSGTTNVPIVDLYTHFAASASASILVDWCFMAKLTANEPSWSSFGAQETNPSYTTQTNNIRIKA